MAVRFIDSMAHYGTGTDVVRKWTNFAGTPNASGGRRNAAYIHFSGGDGAAKTLTHQTNWILGAAAQMQPGAGLLSGNILSVCNNHIEIVSVAINHDATLSLRFGGTNTGVSSLAVADPISWHYYEMQADIGVSGGFLTGTATVFVDGKQFITGSGVTSINTSGLVDGSATANQVGVINAGAMGWMDFYCLDTGVTDMNGFASTHTAFLGDIEVDALFPAADVTANWGTVGGDGTHAYTCVNENPPDDDTSYILTTATGSIEKFTYQPIVGFTGDIIAAQYLVCARKDAEGSRVINLSVGTALASTIEFLGTDNYLSDFYVYYIAPLDTDMGVAWTTSVYNAEAFGVKLAS